MLVASCTCRCKSCSQSLPDDILRASENFQDIRCDIRRTLTIIRANWRRNIFVIFCSNVLLSDEEVVRAPNYYNSNDFIALQ